MNFAQTNRTVWDGLRRGEVKEEGMIYSTIVSQNLIKKRNIGAMKPSDIAQRDNIQWKDMTFSRIMIVSLKGKYV